MKNIFLIILVCSSYLTNAQIINIPDTNFKNKLLSANLTNGIALDINFQPLIIDINGDNQIDVNEVINVAILQVFSSSISDLTGVEKFTNLQRLAVNNNFLNNINISTLTQLKILRCDFNFLSAIDLTGLTAIEGLNISHNNFSNFNFNNLPNLDRVVCSYNQLSTLNFSDNPLLMLLECKNNNLTTLNIKNGINQDFSVAGYNECWKTGNPNLTTICADASEVASVQSFLNGCGTAQTINVTSNCGLANQEFSNDVGVYPNPFEDKLIVDTTKLLNEYNSIEIYNTIGSLVYSNSILSPINEIDLSSLPDGIYIASLIGNSKRISLKLIKN